MGHVTKSKLLAISVAIILGISYLDSNGLANESERIKMASRGYMPKEGFVPDAQTAIRVALVILTRIYGQQKIESEAPFRAELRDGVWTIEGRELPRDMAGGVAIIKLSKQNGRILYVNHEK